MTTTSATTSASDAVRPEPSGGSPSRTRRLLAWAGEHPLVTVFVVAFTVRFVVALVIALTTRGVLIPDERQYLELATYASDGRGVNAWQQGYGGDLYRTAATFLVPLSALFKVFGPARGLGQLLAALGGAGVAAITTALCLGLVRRRVALGVGLAAALWPSQILWSSVVLRESFVWAGLALLALGIIRSARSEGWRDAALWGVVVVAALFGLGHLRGQTFLVAVWLVPLAMLVLAEGRRVVATVAAVGVLVLLPIPIGQGPAGWTLIEQRLPALDRTRVNSAAGADSSFIPSASTSTTVPNAHARTTTTTILTSADPVQGETPVVARDGRVYVVDEGVQGNLRYLPRGLVATVFRPVIGGAGGSTELELASFENLAWYVLYGFALAGLWLGRRRWRHLAVPTMLTGLVVVQIALIQGNYGTTFRHRGQVLWALLVLASVSVERLADRWHARRA